jgi:hypothetical protein
MRCRLSTPALCLSGLLALLAIGCGGPSDTTPVACLEGANSYLAALEDAPGEVKLSGDTPISDCLAENQQGGDLAAVGAATIETATELNAKARENPGGTENLQLGYLLGAAQRGADETGGIHAELIRRLAAAARYSPDNHPLPPRFLRAYRQGYDAGFARG